MNTWMKSTHQYTFDRKGERYSDDMNLKQTIERPRFDGSYTIAVEIRRELN